jgi:hypothetical protein
MADDKAKSLQHRIAGMSRWAGIDPDARAEHMRMMAAAAAAKRQAAREAAGLPEPRRSPRREPLPEAEVLAPYLEDIQARRASAGEQPLSYDALLREAALQSRRDIAQQAYDALKGDR